MSKITFNSASIRSLAEKVRTNAAEIEDELKKLEEICNNIQFSWQGKDSRVYVDKVNQKRTQFLKVNSDFKNLATLLDKYATSMEQKQQSIAEEGSRL